MSWDYQVACSFRDTYVCTTTTPIFLTKFPDLFLFFVKCFGLSRVNIFSTVNS